jgi:hypothetical protein
MTVTKAQAEGMVDVVVVGAVVVVVLVVVALVVVVVVEVVVVVVLVVDVEVVDVVGGVTVSWMLPRSPPHEPEYPSTTMKYGTPAVTVAVTREP